MRRSPRERSEPFVEASKLIAAATRRELARAATDPTRCASTARSAVRSSSLDTVDAPETLRVFARVAPTAW
jgi:hypothetical protein